MTASESGTTAPPYWNVRAYSWLSDGLKENERLRFQSAAVQATVRCVTQDRPGTRLRSSTCPGAPTRTVAVRRVVVPTTMRERDSATVAGSRPALNVRTSRPSTPRR